MSWRLACLAPGQDIRIKPVAAKDASKDASTTSDARRGTRDVLFEGLGSVSCGVYDVTRSRPARRSKGRRWWKSANPPAASDPPRGQRRSVFSIW